MMNTKSPWAYYYAAKDALSMIDAYFVFSNKDDAEYRDAIETIYDRLKRIGTLIAEGDANVN